MQKRLLVVDDDAGLTRIASLTARTIGILTTQVNDPMLALDSFLAVRPQAVLLDMFMPEKDGVDLLHEMLLTGIPTRIALMSGMGEDLLKIAEEAARFHGITDATILAKPFRRAQLLGVLARLFDGVE